MMIKKIFLIFLLSLISSPALAVIDPFPVYDSIRPNIAFWEKVYTEYPSSMGYIHDSRRLDIIYEVIELVDRDRRGARRKNRKKIKQVKARYRKILDRLAASKKPATAEEKRVLALFGAKADRKSLRAARNNIRFQLCQRDRFLPGLIRSGAYLAEMKKIFRDYGLPQDLVYLPHVESSFNYKAYSKFGAAGIWQFTRSTGRHFLTVDYTLDERRDPIRATHAAARFLKENYQKLGSWPLALTAYNHGVNGMVRAQKSKGDYESIFNNYRGRRFKFASRNFYSEFLAAREIAKNYQKYYGDVTLMSPVKTHELQLAGFVDVKDIARYFNVDLETIRELNPALRKPVFAGQKYIPRGYHLRLPGNLNGNFKKLAAAMPQDIFKSRQKRSRFYRVERGDTAGLIARRHRVKLADLILANNLNSRATIYVGQNLRIPSPDEKIIPRKPETAKIVQAALEKSGISPEPVPEKIKPPVCPLPQKPAAVKTVPLKAVSPPKVTPVKEPAAKQVKIKKEQAAAEIPVKIPEKEMTGKEAPPLAGLNSSVVIGNFEVTGVRCVKGQPLGTILVQAGETLGHYADWLEVPTQRIRKLNNLPFGRSIHLDQQIRIPLNNVSPEEFAVKRYEYHKEIEEDFFGAYQVEEVKIYKVKSGDNIWNLCQEFDLPFWLINKYNNNINLNALMPGQEMNVPVVRAVAGLEDS